MAESSAVELAREYSYQDILLRREADPNTINRTNTGDKVLFRKNNAPSNMTVGFPTVGKLGLSTDDGGVEFFCRSPINANAQKGKELIIDTSLINLSEDSYGVRNLPGGNSVTPKNIAQTRKSVTDRLGNDLHSKLPIPAAALECSDSELFGHLDQQSRQGESKEDSESL